ncbi:hypothetical protein H5410_007710 [Solanum commersonii]|uniref:lipoyl(octanoyl) transferase n=1 Tax=Solanum commersonii TaxID=4109 RepID=A0A9J6ADX4_SOLCO|nr:hypothetical protein H5410_007710 [Solanum commersonii]
MRRSLEVWKMGTINYLKALKLQEKLASDRKALKITDTLLSLQHPPTYTIGKRETVHNLLIPDTELKSMGAELHYTQRGGDITFHGPHQAILYPIVLLRDIGLGARMYVEKLELTMIELASIYGVKAQAGQKCETGVWVEDRKIGAIGVRISSGITSHGLAFNMDPDLNYFKHIVPCGIVDKGVTSLKNETDVELPAEDVIQEQLIACFRVLFMRNLSSFDPMEAHVAVAALYFEVQRSSRSEAKKEELRRQELKLARGRGLAGVFNFRPSQVEEGKVPTPDVFGSKMNRYFLVLGAKNHMPSVNQKPRLLAENEVESYENVH